MSWESDKQLARGVLRDRNHRRKIMARLLAGSLAMMACGLWVVDGWLASGVWRFLLWWGACGFFTCMTMGMAAYDMLAVIREEREKGD
jgi:hypothetical protein